MDAHGAGFDALRFRTVRLGGNTFHLPARDARTAFAETTAGQAVGGGSMRRPGSARFVAWRATGASLWLAEMDPLGELSNNALQLVFGAPSGGNGGGNGGDGIGRGASVALFEERQSRRLLVCVLTDSLVVHRLLFEQHGEASVFAAVCTAASDHAACHEMTEKRGFAGLTSFFVGLRGAGAEGLGGLDPTEVTCFQWASHETLVVGTRSGSVARLQWSDAGNHNNNHHNVGGLDALPRVGACAMHSPVFSLVDKKTKRQKVQPP